MGLDDYISRLFPNLERTQVEILENIEALLAEDTGANIQQNVKKADVYDDAGPSGTNLMDATRYLTLETSDLDEANADGSITLSPGDEQALVRYDQGTPVALSAIGAFDENDVTYALRAENSRIVGGTHSSPLGALNDPFSFVQKMGAAVPVESFEYVAIYPPSATGDVDLAARAHMEVIG